MAVKIFIVGLCGYMGKVTAAYCEHDARFEVVGGLDAFADPQTSPYPLFKSAAEVNLEYDAIIDFSNPAVLPELKVLAERDKKALVIATTGYSEEQKRERDAMSDTIPLFTSANMSLGINLLSRLAQDIQEGLPPSRHRPRSRGAQARRRSPGADSRRRRLRRNVPLRRLEHSVDCTIVILAADVEAVGHWPRPCVSRTPALRHSR